MAADTARKSYDRWVSSWDDYNNEEIVRRSADDLRRHGSPEQADRLERVADDLVVLARLVAAVSAPHREFF